MSMTKKQNMVEAMSSLVSEVKQKRATKDQIINNVVEAVTTMFLALMQEFEEQNVTMSEAVINISNQIESGEDELTVGLRDVVASIIKPKVLKDPEAPKAPKTSYMCFASENRPTVVAKYPGKTSQDISRVLGVMWSEMTPKQKQKYVEMAEQSKVEYSEKMKVYVRPSVEELKEKKAQKRTRTKKLAGEPKRPMTAYMLYAQAKRQEFKDNNPELKGAEISKLLGAKWKTLSEHKKGKYVKLAEEEKGKYQVLYAEFMEKKANGELPEEEQKEKKPRGRPKKSKEPEAEVVEEDAEVEEAPKKKRKGKNEKEEVVEEVRRSPRKVTVSFVEDEAPMSPLDE
jgi:hypothetical protein